MPGFGSGPFGSGPFGEFPWSKQVLFRDLPEIDRRIDAEIEGTPLETTMSVIQGTFDELLKKVRNFGDLRDALQVRTLHNEQISVNILKAEPSADGRTIEVLLDNPNPDDLFDPLFGTSIGWILIGNEGREFTVNSVHKLREAGPTIELKGTSETPATARNKGSALTGTVSFTEGSTTVVGAGTAFLSEVSPGQLIGPAGTFDIAFVDSVTDDFTLELTSAWSADTTEGTNALVGTVSDGSAILRPPSLIETFGGDFGIEVDRHEPEVFQRSSVFDVEQWLNLKGSARAYDIIGKIAGYRVEALGLWRIGEVARIDGAVSFTNGSVTVTGVGTSFLSQVAPGEFIAPDVGLVSGVVSVVVSDTEITLASPYTGPDVSTPEAVVFDTPLPTAVDIDTVFESPAGSGKLYTTTEPRLPSFDEIGADVIPTDMYCHETPDWTTEAISPPTPPPPDGTSVEDAIGYSLVDSPIVSTSFLGDNRWSLRVQGDLSIITGLGSWFADFAGAPGGQHFIETVPVEQLTSITGNLSFTNGNTAVTGGGAFTTEIVAGQYITLGGNTPRVRVQSVTDDTNLVLEDPYPGTTDVGPGFIGNEWDIEVIADPSITFGATVSFGYACRIEASCGFCRASVIRVEVVPVEVLTDPQSLLDRALVRLVTKVQQVIPAHVRLTEIIQIIGPAQAFMNYQAQAQTAAFVSAEASAKFMFDVEAADTMPLDPDHYVAYGSVSTVP